MTENNPFFLHPYRRAHPEEFCQRCTRQLSTADELATRICELCALLIGDQA